MCSGDSQPILEDSDMNVENWYGLDFRSVVFRDQTSPPSQGSIRQIGKADDKKEFRAVVLCNV